MVNPSTESILNQMTNLAMDIALDYVLPASPMSDVCKGDLFEFEREVVAAVNSSVADGLMSSFVSSTVGSAGGCCGRPPINLCKKNSYMGAAGCDSCNACVARLAKQAALSNPSKDASTGSISSCSPSLSKTSTTPSPQAAAETTMDISWCQFDGCEFDTADNSYLDICDWIFYADRYALTDENLEKVQKAFQMVPPSDVTGYVAQPPQPLPKTSTKLVDDIPITFSTTGFSVKSESDDDYLWTSDNHLQPIILKAESNADILQITELDHSYLQTPVHSSSVNSSASVSPAKHHPNHLNADMLGLVTPPPSRSQSSEEEEIDVVNDNWDTPDTPRKGATMADIMKRGIVKKRDPPVTKWKNTVKRKFKSAGAALSPAYPMPPPPPKKLCSGGLSLLDRYKKDTVLTRDVTVKVEPVKEEPVKEEPVDDEQQQPPQFNHLFTKIKAEVVDGIKPEPLDYDDEANEYDVDADFESLMKNEPEDLFEDDYDDYDDENDVDWDKIFRGSSGSPNADSSTRGGGRGHRGGNSSGGFSSSCSSSSGSSTTTAGRKKKKKKKKKKNTTTSTKSSSSSSSYASKHQHHQHQQHHPDLGKKIKYEPGCGGYSYKTKLMDPVKRALHNDLEKSRRVETSMLFMNLSMQVSFLDDNRKIPSKLSILRGAKRECDLMMLDERRLLSEKHTMQQKQRMLRERLFELRREQFHRRYGKINGNGNHTKQEPQ